MQYTTRIFRRTILFITKDVLLMHNHLLKVYTSIQPTNKLNSSKLVLADNIRQEYFVAKYLIAKDDIRNVLLMHNHSFL
jgi:hypothetical protein